MTASEPLTRVLTFFNVLHATTLTLIKIGIELFHGKKLLIDFSYFFVFSIFFNQSRNWSLTLNIFIFRD